MFERYNFDMKLGNVRDVLKASAVLRAVVDPSFLNLIADVTVEALPKKGPMIGHDPDLKTIKKLVDEIDNTVDDDRVKEILKRIAWPMAGEGRINVDTFGRDLSILRDYKERYPVINKVIDLLRFWPAFQVQGMYLPDERKIVIYGCESLQDVEKRCFCFGHECFHAYHFHELEKKTGDVHFDGCPCKVKIVVESLAAYYELKTAEACGDTEYRDRRIDELRKYHVFLFPYSGALQIFNDDHFHQIFRASVDQSIDAAYDLFIKERHSCNLDEFLLSSRTRRNGIPFFVRPVPWLSAPTSSSKSITYIVHIHMRDGKVVSWHVNSNLDPNDVAVLRRNVLSHPIYRDLNHSGKLADVLYIEVLVPAALFATTKGSKGSTAAVKTGSISLGSRPAFNIKRVSSPLPGVPNSGTKKNSVFTVTVYFDDGTKVSWNVKTNLDLYDDKKIKNNVMTSAKIRLLRKQGRLKSVLEIEALIYDPFKKLLDEFHEYLEKDCGFSDGSADSYVSYIRSGFNIYLKLIQKTHPSESLTNILRGFMAADDNGKTNILDLVDKAVILEFGVKGQRSLKSICSATAKLRTYLEHLSALIPSSAASQGSQQPKKIKLPIPAGSLPVFSKNEILRNFMNRAGTWDRFYLSGKNANGSVGPDDRCFPVRIYNAIFAGDAQYRGWRETMLLNVKFLTGPNPSSTIALKDVNYLRIDDASHEVYVEAFGAEHLVYNEVFVSGSKTSTYSPLIVDPANELREISIDHTIPMESFYKQSDGSHKLPPQMKLLSDDVCAYIISDPNLPYKNSVKGSEVLKGYGTRFNSINGFSKAQLKAELRDLYLNKMKELRIMGVHANSSKGKNIVP